MRIGNCSGFYGDRLTAMREMLEGGELDYLTGDTDRLADRVAAVLPAWSAGLPGYGAVLAMHAITATHGSHLVSSTSTPGQRSTMIEGIISPESLEK